MLPIVFGFPSSETFAAADRGEIALGGCVVMGEEPTHRCLACGEDVILDDRVSLLCATCGLPLDGNPEDDSTRSADGPDLRRSDRNRNSEREEAAAWLRI